MASAVHTCTQHTCVHMELRTWQRDAVGHAEHEFEPGSPQHKFIQRDLESVDRSVTPWVIVGGHRPVRCLLCLLVWCAFRAVPSGGFMLHALPCQRLRRLGLAAKPRWCALRSPWESALLSLCFKMKGRRTGEFPGRLFLLLLHG